MVERSAPYKFRRDHELALLIDKPPFDALFDAGLVLRKSVGGRTAGGTEELGLDDELTSSVDVSPSSSALDRGDPLRKNACTVKMRLNLKYAHLVDVAPKPTLNGGETLGECGAPLKVGGNYNGSFLINETAFLVEIYRGQPFGEP